MSAQVKQLVNAGFAGIWVSTVEPQEFILDLRALVQDKEWSLSVWDVDRGMEHGGSVQEMDPLGAIHFAMSLSPAEGSSALVVLQNMHRFLENPVISQAIENAIYEGKRIGVAVIVTAPTPTIPQDLSRLFALIEDELPGREKLLSIAREIHQQEDYEDAVAAANGLTGLQAENAFALSVVQKKMIDPDVVWAVKSQEMVKDGLLTVHRNEGTFASLGGLDCLKEFCLKALKPRPGKPKARGVMLLSPPGCGKTQFAKSLGAETHRPTIVFDPGSMMGSLVGETEGKVRRAIKMIDAMSPCVVLIDEVEKALSGVQSSGQTDSGVTARMFGTLLTWLNDRESDSFVVATCNDSSKLPPEFSRAERFDGIFFVDLPQRDQKDQIWSIYMQQYEIAEQEIPKDDDWTGAEIKACCRLAAMLDETLKEASQRIVPVAVTANEKINSLREWASCRCLSADQAGMFNRSSSNRRRSVKAS